MENCRSITIAEMEEDLASHLIRAKDSAAKVGHPRLKDR